MRKFLIAAAVATSAIAAATPAAAQYYPAPQYGYGYGQPQGYGYGQPRGYGYNYNQQGLVRSYIVRADQLRNRIERLDGRDRVSEREARWLRQEAADLQGRTRAYARGGLSGRERQELDQRLHRLAQAVRHEANDRDGFRWGNYDGQRRDRDRDGRWDRRDRWVDNDRDGRDDRYERRRDRDDD